MARKGFLTYKDLANGLGISATQLSNILSDRFEPIKSNVNHLAKFFEVSPLDLIEDDVRGKE